MPKKFKFVLVQTLKLISYDKSHLFRVQIS